MNAQRDVTSKYITNATLSDGTNGWISTHTKSQTTNDPADAFTKSTRGNNTVGYATEAYAGWGSLIQTAYSMKQTITLPAGSYRLVNYSFYRQGAEAATNPSKSLAYLVAGEKKVAIKTLGSITAKGYANSQAEGANVFDSKMYRNVIEFTIDADNTPLEIGVEGTFDEPKCWCIVGQFELFDLNDLASVSSPTDMTYAITNPGFEYRDLTGWLNEGFNCIDNNDNIGGKAGNAYVEYYNGGGLENNKYISQTLTGLENGLYEVTVYGHQQQGTPNDGVKLYANSDFTYIGSTTQDYSVRTTVSNNELTIKIQTEGSTANWTAFDKFRLKFYGDPLAAYQDLLDAAVTTAQALINGDAGSAISPTAKAAWQAVVDANDNDDNAFTTENDFNSAIENINNANSNYQAMAAPYAAFGAMKTKANGLKNQSSSYTDPGTAVSTLESAISSANSAVEEALTADAINIQIENVRKAAFAFLGNVTLNDKATIDITAFINNAGFDETLNTGWNIAGYTAYDGTDGTWHSYSTNYSCGEFYQAKFDISQTLTDLPANKSFKLKVQAFQRPGDIAAVYTAYGNSDDKTKNVTSEIYVNSKSQKIKNIVSEFSTTELFDGTGLDEWTRDSKCADNVYVPNSMKGASVYFATDYSTGVKFYESEVAAAADNTGTLKFGFRDNTSGAGAWTIFDNFRLYYAGDDLSGFAADLTSVISSVKTSVDGLAIGDAVKTKLKSLADSYEKTYSSADEYTEAITAVNSIETIGLRYEAVASLTKITNNVGEGIFQYNSTTNDDLWNAYSTAKGNADSYSGSTIAGFEALVVEVETALTNYNNQALNAPADGTFYNIVNVTSGFTHADKALTFKSASNANLSENSTSMGWNEVPGALYPQGVKFTAVDAAANKYKISYMRADGNEVFIGTGKTTGLGDNTNQIRPTTDASKALTVKVIATNTDNVWKLLNTEANANLGSNGDEGFYTADGKNSDVRIQVAVNNEVNLNIKSANRYGTLIVPFNVTIPDGVVAYSCATTSGSILTLESVASLKANKPYIVYAESGKTATLAGLGAAYNDASYTEGLLTGVYTATTAPTGSYVLQNNNDNVAFYLVAEGEGEQPTVGANRCYLTVPTTARPAFFFGDDNTTGIEAINALTNGTAEIYNVNGVKVPALQKGMNIVKTANGKTQKILVK